MGVLGLLIVLHASCVPAPGLAPLEVELHALLGSDSTQHPRAYSSRLCSLQRRYVRLQLSQDRDVVHQALMGEGRLLAHLARLQRAAPLPRRLSDEQRAIYLAELHRTAASTLRRAVVKLNGAVELSRVAGLEGPCADSADILAQNARTQLDSLFEVVRELGR